MLEQLQEWMEYIQQPGKLGNNPICPFAAKAVKQKRVDVIALTDLKDSEMLIDEVDVTKFDVSIFYFEQYLDYSIEELENRVKYLLSKNPEYIGHYILDKEIDKIMDTKNVLA